MPRRIDPDEGPAAHPRRGAPCTSPCVGAAIQSLGGDPTAQTPAADVTGVEGMGLMQVLTDPKTTVAQALHAILVAEMTDNAAWEELIELT